MCVNFSTTREETDTIIKIVQRAIKMAPEIDRSTVLMDITAVHANGCPLKLDELLTAGDGDFAHDVFGIMRHIDRHTGKLEDLFLPRYANTEVSL